MKTIAFALLMLAFCRVTHAADGLVYLSWGEAKKLSRADGKPIVRLMGWSEGCPPCKYMREEVLPSLYRKGHLDNVHVAWLDAILAPELFHSLRDPSNRGVPQLLITDLQKQRVHVGRMDEATALRWLRGK